MIRKAHLSDRPDIVRITFSLPSSIWADTIYLVGDFNNWNTTATPLRLDESDWSITLDLDIDQAYEYRYLVNNDEWLSDWNADNNICDRDGLTSSVVMTYTSRPIPLHVRPSLPREQTADVVLIAA